MPTQYFIQTGYGAIRDNEGEVILTSNLEYAKELKKMYIEQECKDAYIIEILSREINNDNE